MRETTLQTPTSVKKEEKMLEVPKIPLKPMEKTIAKLYVRLHGYGHIKSEKMFL